MKRYFCDIHSSYINELGGESLIIEDSEDVISTRVNAHDAESFVLYGKALAKQLRYRDAIAAYSKALEFDSNSYDAHRLRGGRYLTTLDLDNAFKDLEWCLNAKGENTDVLYVLGLTAFYSEKYNLAREYFERAILYSDDEMGVAIIYWHTIASLREKEEATLLNDKYHMGMDIGHHTAYDKALSLFKGYLSMDSVESMLEDEDNDLEYSMIEYGIANYYQAKGDMGKAKKALDNVLSRDGFWPSFAFIGAWNDRSRNIL